MTQFLIVRHGETWWNRLQRIQGQRNSALSPAGERQAHAAAEHLRGAACTRLVSSDLGRAMQTAQPIALALGLPIETDERLRERAFGQFEGATPDEIRARDPEAHARWQAREPDYAMPEGESLATLRARVRSCIDALAAMSPARDAAIALVTHGGVLDAIYRIAAGIALDAPRTWPLLNAGINRVAVEQGIWRVVAWGEAAHLAAARDDFG